MLMSVPNAGDQIYVQYYAFFARSMSGFGSGYAMIEEVTENGLKVLLPVEEDRSDWFSPRSIQYTVEIPLNGKVERKHLVSEQREDGLLEAELFEVTPKIQEAMEKRQRLKFLEDADIHWTLLPFDLVHQVYEEVIKFTAFSDEEVSALLEVREEQDHLFYEQLWTKKSKFLKKTEKTLTSFSEYEIVGE